MHIYIDADACPQVVKNICFDVALRRNIPVTLVANAFVRHPESPLFKFIQTSTVADAADAKIVELIAVGELAITQDIPLAALIVKKEAYAMSPRGLLFSTANISEKLSMRNFMTDLRGMGVETSGPAPYVDRDRQSFINALDRFLTKHL